MIPDEFESCGGRISDNLRDLHDRREKPRRDGAHRASAAAARGDAVQLVRGHVHAVGKLANLGFLNSLHLVKCGITFYLRRSHAGLFFFRENLVNSES